MKFIYSSLINTHRLAKIAVLFALSMLPTLYVQAAPANDNFANAQSLGGNSGSLVNTNVGATKQTGEPNHAGNFGGASVWYSFTSPSDGVLKVDTTGSSFDTLLGVYTGQLVSNLSRLGESDNEATYAGGSMFSRVSIGIKAGVTYYIALDGKNAYNSLGPASGTFALHYSFVSADSNDNFANAVQLNDGGGVASWVSTNVGASKEAGEPNHLNNAGGRSVWFKYFNGNLNYPRQISLRVSTAGGAAVNGGGVKNVVGIYTGSSVNTLTPVTTGSAGTYYVNQRYTFLALPFTDYYIAVDGYNTGQGADTGTFTLTYSTAKDTGMADVDKDGRADPTVFRPSTGAWYSLESGAQHMRTAVWGTSTDIPLMTRSVSDDPWYTAFRPESGSWYMTPSGSAFSLYTFGASGDIPLFKSYRFQSGATIDLLSVFRPSTGTWWIKSGNIGYPVQFGLPGDLPVSADFDGDGHDELTVFRPSNGTWYIYNQMTGQDRTIQFGLNGDKPVAADYDSDGIADIAVFRPSNGTWYTIASSNGAVRTTKFGQAGDRPQPADYDGDGSADLAVFRNGTWWIKPSNPQYPAKAIQWGLSTDTPVTSPVN